MNRPLTFVPLLLTVPLAAQGLLIGPDPVRANGPVRHSPPNGGPVGVHIAKTSIQARIVDGVATTTIDQVIRNNGGRDAEGTWFLPLPNGAVADGFTMTIGGKEIAGEVLDAGQARSVYERIVRRRRDPGLLEYAGDGMLRARIFPIPARGEVSVTVRLQQVLQPTGSLFEWSWPLRTAKLGDAACGAVGLTVEVQSQTPLSTVVTPHGAAEIRRQGEHRATVSLEGRNGDFEDLRVLYGLTEQEFGLHLLPFRGANEAGYFTMLLSPPRDLLKVAVPPRLVQFVVDTSGSMKGDKIRQAKASLRSFLASLRPQDRFQIITFASDVQTFFDEPCHATAENVATAQRRVDELRPMGGTNIAGALQQAFGAVPRARDDGSARLSQIIFVTDGEPTVGVTRPKQILEVARAADLLATRLFALGVGDGIDVRLIDDLVEQHRGARDFVGHREKIETKVDALCRKLSRPALTDVVVRCEGLDAFDVHPTRTRDLFCGEMLQVVGRYRDHGTHVVRVTGKQGGIAREYQFEVNFPERAAKYPFVQTIWARQHVATLLKAIRDNGQKRELVDEVRQLATRYGVVTPYTSQLIVEEGMRLAGRSRARSRRGDPASGPTSPGPQGGGVAAPVPSGPATGGPAGRAAPRSRAPDGLARLGKARTGKEAIAESVALGGDDLYLGSTRRMETTRPASKPSAPMIRRASGRTFVVVGGALIEQGLPKDWRKQAVVIEAYSKAYFDLLRQQPALRQVLALGDHIAFVDGKRVVLIKPAKAVKPNRGAGRAKGK